MELRYKGNVLSGSGPISSDNMYSDEETVIGTCFGKPLYQRSFPLEFNTKNGGDMVLVAASENQLVNCDVIDISGNINQTGLGVTLQFSLPALTFSGNNHMFISAQRYLDSIYMLTYWSSVVHFEGFITINYTKTTD